MKRKEEEKRRENGGGEINGREGRVKKGAQNQALVQEFKKNIKF